MSKYPGEARRRFRWLCRQAGTTPRRARCASLGHLRRWQRLRASAVLTFSLCLAVLAVAAFGVPGYRSSAAGRAGVVGAALVSMRVGEAGQVGLAGTGGSASGVAAAPCADIYFLGARGSGEKTTPFGGLGPEVAKMESVAHDALAARQITMDVVADPYSADPVTELEPTKYEIELFKKHPVRAAKYWYAHNVVKYIASINRGIADAVSEAKATLSQCPHAVLILAGYSQGAMVMHQAELQLAENDKAVLGQIAATLLLGDGDRVPHTAATEFGTSAAKAEGVRTWLGRNSGKDVALPGSTANICNARDIVCDFGVARILDASAAIKIHESYAVPGKNGKYSYDPALAKAATWAAGLAAAAEARYTRNPGQLNNLQSVQARSGSDAWAVGFYCTSCTQFDVSDKTLILRWDGKSWFRITSPNAGTTNELVGISADSATDAWAVGVSCTPNCGSGQVPLMLHWNGSTWARVPGPVSAAGTLQGVASVSPVDAWAVGNTQLGKTLVLHWNGSTWSQVPSPGPGAANDLTGISADSATDAWAVGTYCSSACTGNGVYPPLILHWNGATWSQTAAPSQATYNILQSVSTVSPGNAWAAGYSGTNSDSLSLHWNGSTWSVVKTPDIYNLWGVSASSAADAWAIGDFPIFLHWSAPSDKWTEVTVPNLGPYSGFSGVSAHSASNAWAVGNYCVSGCSGNSPVLDNLILHWNGKSWTQG